MIVEPYIDNECQFVPVDANLEEVRSHLTRHRFLVVTGPNTDPVGLITFNDLSVGATSVSGCLYQKPFVAPGQKVIDIANLMQKNDFEILPVKENGKFLGVIKSKDLLYALAKEVKKHQLLFQHVAHDLRNPIGDVLGIFTLLKDSVTDQDSLEIIGYGHESCSQAIAMLDELLTIEKKKHHQSGFQIIELSRFVPKCIQLLKGTVSLKNICFQSALSPDEFFAKIEPNHFQRVLHNILSNAVKFSPVNGSISITSEVIVAESDKPKWRLAIRDQGIGIPFEIQGFVFDQFSSAQRKGTAGEKATGLGLYFAKKTMEQHGGRIWFESVENHGTTFFIELPSY